MPDAPQRIPILFDSGRSFCVNPLGWNALTKLPQWNDVGRKVPSLTLSLEFVSHMSREVMEFEFGTQKLKAILGEDGQAWFVASEICEILEISKYRDAVARLDEDERMPLVVDTPHQPDR